MKNSERRQVAKTLRAAANVLMGADMQQLKTLEKIGRGVKTGTYDPVEIVEALKLLDPKWSIEETVGVITGHGYSDINEYIGSRLKPHVPYGVHVSPALTKKEPYAFMVKNRGSREDAAALLPLVENLFVKAPKKGPPVADHDQLYATGKIGVEEVAPGYFILAVHGVMLGVPVWKITAPEGQVLELPVSPNRKGRYAEREMTKPTLWTWLFKKVPGVQEAARDMAAGSGLEEKRQQQRLQKKGKPGDFGTCAVCDRTQKLKRNKMVLHGYRRPGYGFIVNNCLGVGYEPYELSAEGCKHAASVYGKMAKDLDRQIAEMPRKKELLVRDSSRAFLVRPDGSVEKLPRSDKRVKDLQAYVGYGWEKDPWKTAVEANREILRRAIKQLEEERDRMILKTKEWKKKPLPGMVE